MQVEGYAHFGGKHGESAAIKNLLAHAGVVTLATGKPFSEALCFGIAGGISAGYSFCPSVPRWGTGSGVTVVGRHLAYAGDASWYQGFFDRIGAATRITETTGTGKAYQNLVAELQAGRPAVVWCSRDRLPFLNALAGACDITMHSFVVYAIDEAKGVAFGSDRAPTRVTLTLDDLAAARNGICSHKSRTLTFVPPVVLTAATLKAAVTAGLQACAKGLLEPRIKTFSLPGLEIWAKMIANGTSKDGWLKVFPGGKLYLPLRDTFHTIQTDGTGGGLYRGMYADFLEEAATILDRPELRELAGTYRKLGEEWTALAEAALPSKIKPFKETKEQLTKKRRLFEAKGEPAARQIVGAVEKLRKLEVALKADFPLDASASAALLGELRERIVALHAAECQAAERLQAVAGKSG